MLWLTAWSETVERHLGTPNNRKYLRIAEQNQSNFLETFVVCLMATSMVIPLVLTGTKRAAGPIRATRSTRSAHATTAHSGWGV